MRFSEGTIYYTAFVIDWTNVPKWDIGHDKFAFCWGVSILKNLDDLNNMAKKRP